MPAFQTSGPLTALYPGDSIALVNNAASDSGLTSTQQVVIAEVSGVTAPLVITNTTNQTATGQASSAPLTSASFKPLTGCVIAAGTSLTYNIGQTTINFTFSVAPTSGSLVVQR